MIVRKLTAFLLAVSVTALIVALCLSDWHCGNLFEHCTEEGIENRNEMLAVLAMLLIALLFLFIVFIFDIMLACNRKVSTGLITARFALIYLGAGLAFVAVILYTAVKTNSWGYFLAIFASTISMVLAVMAVATSRCVSRSEMTPTEPQEDSLMANRPPTPPTEQEEPKEQVDV